MIGLPNKKDATAAAGVGGCSGLLNKNNTTQLLLYNIGRDAAAAAQSK